MTQNQIRQFGEVIAPDWRLHSVGPGGVRFVHNTSGEQIVFRHNILHPFTAADIERFRSGLAAASPHAGALGGVTIVEETDTVITPASVIAERQFPSIAVNEPGRISLPSESPHATLHDAIQAGVDPEEALETAGITNESLMAGEEQRQRLLASTTQSAALEPASTMAPTTQSAASGTATTGLTQGTGPPGPPAWIWLVLAALVAVGAIAVVKGGG